MYLYSHSKDQGECEQSDRPNYLMQFLIKLQPVKQITDFLGLIHFETKKIKSYITFTSFLKQFFWKPIDKNVIYKRTHQVQSEDHKISMYIFTVLKDIRKYFFE